MHKGAPGYKTITGDVMQSAVCWPGGKLMGSGNLIPSIPVQDGGHSSLPIRWRRAVFKFYRVTNTGRAAEE